MKRAVKRASIGAAMILLPVLGALMVYALNHVDGVSPEAETINCEGPSPEKVVLAHCPTPHRSHGKDLFRFSYYPASRSVVYSDLSTASVLEADFEEPEVGEDLQGDGAE